MAEDRRVRKSKRAIKQAFIQLLTENNLDRITIQQISDLADVNRGTFYLNYEDKYALLDEMENEQIEEIKGYVDIRKMDLSTKTSDRFIEEFANKVIKNVITHIEQNMEFYQVILNLERKSQIEEQLADIVRSNIKHLIGNKDNVFGIPENYYLSYVVGSMMSMIKYWVSDENRVSVEELVNYVSTIASTGPLSIMKRMVDENIK
ncbi:TetR family transcriptional regulator C-terminal domain-containing protein [Mammaliicoccus sciuri]|uniref:TetR/AcrR family transcriptional regulator n=1 Tax=Mammaliicoccus sciuri TaxID=1296 RepID=A0AAI8DJX2_MAMSC|nr:TetR/AcrR family transcriptional regulator C-terminal domain-containing protein [Mammaliicoccus sciuri]OOV38858.1 TetR family transcriptional regulator [Staphylococcus sp. MB371]PCQ20315.1 TetR/AcrR family transcriptional regulator [Klebsiella pneumoniae]ASE35003.1 TetR/AcrR family transcriptional regulator [Mammaliicoccus sciuri]MCD8777428.1 TetR family transcriptional regulator C-terminal domain-containing protein [Mammaliicoccus sciuri]MCD8780814.1 TetR family transcriptional regulator C